MKDVEAPVFFQKNDTFAGRIYVMKGLSSARLPIIAAFAAIYIIWGSTYLMSYYAVQDIPPFLMSGIRFTIAGTLLLTFTLLKGKPWPAAIHWRDGSISGILFLAVGIGPVAWAVKYIDTGLAALLVSFVPLAVVLFVWLRHGRKPSLGGTTGVILGIIGMSLLVGQPQIHHNMQTWIAIAAVLFAVLSWSATSVYISAFALPKSGMQTSAIQMLGAGITLISYGLLTGEGLHFAVAEVGFRAWLSLGYLIFAGSLLAYSSFNYLLSKVPPEQVSTSNFVNPVVALWLGWMFKGEALTLQSILAATLLLSGVFFINSRFVRGKATS